MTGRDLAAILPLLIVTGDSVLVMLVAAFRRSHGVACALTLVGLAAAFASLFSIAPIAPRQVTPLLLVDGFALFYMGLMFVAAIAVTLFAYGYLEEHAINREEFYVLLLAATLGSAVLACSNHFASFFLGLEVLSVGLYALIAYLPARRRPVEAALKYLILAGASAAFLLFGIALVYAATGTMEFGGFAAGGGTASRALFVAGTAMLVTGFGFKLAVVPFHMWTPDVYEGAPAPVTAFIATVSKGGMFALLVRYFGQSSVAHAGALFVVFSIVAIASMFGGNLLALLQGNVKRILAYSSIAHFGYFLVAFLAADGAFGPLAATVYLTAYFVTILGAFGIVSVVSRENRDADRIDDYRGLFWRRPALGIVFSAMLLSLAGIPLTAGFVGKFYVVAAGASMAAWALVISLVVSSAIGLFYYLRILAALYETAEAPATAPRVPVPGVVALACLVFLLVWIGVYPSLFVNAITAAVSALPL